MHKEAYFVLDLSVTLAILTLLFNLCFLNFPVTMEESYVLGCNTSGREVKIRAVIFVHCLSLWQIPSQSTLHPCLRKSFLLSQHSSFAYLSKALSNRGVVGFHTGCLQQSKFFCKISAHALKWSVQFLLF